MMADESSQSSRGAVRKKSLKKITVSELRTRVRQVLNEVQYRQVEYVVSKFGEPAVVIINFEAYRLLLDKAEQAEDEGDHRGD